MERRRSSRQTTVRELRLHRRRSRNPWIYLLYHRVPDEPARCRGPRRKMSRL